MIQLSVPLSLLSPHQRGDLPPTAINDLARRFPNLVPETDFEQLEEEFLDYQTTPASDFPKVKDVRTDKFWEVVLQMEHRIIQQPRFPLMKKLVSGVLTIPNSNAYCKKVFSFVKKIQSSMRSNLNNSTLNA